MTSHDAGHLVFEIGKLGYRFSDWEKGLMKLIERRIELNISLTAGQSKALEEIYCKAAGGGAILRRQYV